jgi:hypothetical protein
MLSYNCQNDHVPTLQLLERSFANAGMTFLMACLIDSERLRISNNYIPIEQRTFQSAAAYQPASLGRVALKIAEVLGFVFNLRD